MWFAIDVDTLQILNSLKNKKEAILIYSQDGKSKRIAKGLYLVSDNNSLYSYETYIVNEHAIDQLIKQGFEWLCAVNVSQIND